MAKEKKEKNKNLRHNPLLTEIEQSDPHVQVEKKKILKEKVRERQRRRPISADLDSDDEEKGRYIDTATSQRILEGARVQQEEIEAEDEARVVKSKGKGKKVKVMIDSDSDDDEHQPRNKGIFDDIAGDDDEYVDVDVEGEAVEAINVTEDDEKALEMFLGHGTGQAVSLGDIIMQKIEEKKQREQEQQQQMTSMDDSESQDGDGHGRSPLDEKIVTVYTEVGRLLRTYKSGSLPKPFKYLPKLTNWIEILYLTAPDQWSPNAMFMATKLFVSSVNSKMAQSFLNTFLLPAVRDDIAEHKKLNYHYYQALKKATFKPAAFFKGVVIPLLESRTCTLRESNILGSVISKVSIPVLHSSAAIVRLCELDFHPAIEMIIGLLVNKKYALPYQVVDSLVTHYLRALSTQSDEEMPVVWHQSLLIFLQRYKNDLGDEAKEAIRLLLKKHIHHEMTPECYRELDHAVESVPGGGGGDQTQKLTHQQIGTATVPVPGSSSSLTFSMDM